MIKNIIFFLLLTNTNLFANEDLKIVCGDINKHYVDLDLSKDFTEKFLTPTFKSKLRKDGFRYFLAGRNCGKNTWVSNTTFEIFFAFKGKNIPSEVIDLGPFSIFPAVFNLSIPRDLDLRKGIILEGRRKEYLMNSHGASGSLSTNRGRGKAKVIIRMN